MCPNFADQRCGLNGADAGIQHDFQEVGPGEDLAVGDVRNDHARSGLARASVESTQPFTPAENRACSSAGSY